MKELNWTTNEQNPMILIQNVLNLLFDKKYYKGKVYKNHLMKKCASVIKIPTAQVQPDINTHTYTACGIK